MPVNRGPGVRQVGSLGTTPKEHRLALAGQYAENAPGVPRPGLLVQANTNVVTATPASNPMTYLVGEAATVISRTVGEGVYTPTTVGATVANRTLATTASPASGSRWDLVWIKQNDQEKGDANNEAVIGVTSGTAAATPTKPTGSVPAGALILSEHQIFAGTSTTAAAPNTTTQLWRHTAARGAPILVRNTTERSEITAPFTGMQVIRLDLTGQPLEAFNGTAWTQITGIRHAEFTGPGFSTSPGIGVSLGGPGSGVAFVQDGAVQINNSFVQADVPGRVKILQDGLYNLTAIILPTSVPGTYSLRITDLSTGRPLASRGSAGYGDRDQSIEAVGAYLTAGTVVEFAVATAASVTLGSRIKITKVQ